MGGYDWSLFTFFFYLATYVMEIAKVIPVKAWLVLRWVPHLFMLIEKKTSDFLDYLSKNILKKAWLVLILFLEFMSCVGVMKEQELKEPDFEELIRDYFPCIVIFFFSLWFLLSGEGKK